MSIRIFSLDLEPVSWQSLQKSLTKALDTKAHFRIATVNPEYLLEAKKNARFRESLKQADIRLVDGFGITLLARLQGERLGRLTGADLLPQLLAWAEEKGLPVVIFNHKQGLSSNIEIKQTLHELYPLLHLEVEHDTYQLKAISYKLVICTYGAPTQEFFLDGIMEPGIKIGVGGALDFLTGKQKRAPKVLRSLGLEWLWRLIQQPKRWRRIVRAVIIFPIQGILEVLKINK